MSSAMINREIVFRAASIIETSKANSLHVYQFNQVTAGADTLIDMMQPLTLAHTDSLELNVKRGSKYLINEPVGVKRWFLFGKCLKPSRKNTALRCSIDLRYGSKNPCLVHFELGDPDLPRTPRIDYATPNSITAYLP